MNEPETPTGPIRTFCDCEQHVCKRRVDRRSALTRYGDIRECGEDLERVDVVCGGFPCQPVSRMGLRRKQGDERWLWPEFARVVRLVRPRFVVVENVPGLLDGPLGDVLGDLAAFGFDAEWESLPAAAFGAPHLRDRVWLLAYPGQEPRELMGEFVTSARRDDVLPERDDRSASERREDRELVALVPGIHPGVAADWWRSQSRVARSAHGLPDAMDRNGALGNAVVPQVAEWIGRQILARAAV